MLSPVLLASRDQEGRAALEINDPGRLRSHGKIAEGEHFKLRPDGPLGSFVSLCRLNLLLGAKASPGFEINDLKIFNHTTLYGRYSERVIRSAKNGVQKERDLDPARSPPCKKVLRTSSPRQKSNISYAISGHTAKKKTNIKPRHDVIYVDKLTYCIHYSRHIFVDPMVVCHVA